MKLHHVLTSAGLAAAALMATPVPALAAWDAGSGTAGLNARAAVLPDPSPPTATADGSSVRVSWRSMAAFPVRGYRLTRFDTLTGQTVDAGGPCAGLRTAPSCTESDVPPGSWSYEVLAVVGTNWTSASGPSAPVVISPVVIAPGVIAPLVIAPPAPPAAPAAKPSPSVSSSPAASQPPASPSQPVSPAPSRTDRPTPSTSHPEPTPSASAEASPSESAPGTPTPSASPVDSPEKVSDPSA